MLAVAEPLLWAALCEAYGSWKAVLEITHNSLKVLHDNPAMLTVRQHIWSIVSAQPTPPPRLIVEKLETMLCARCHSDHRTWQTPVNGTVVHCHCIGLQGYHTVFSVSTVVTLMRSGSLSTSINLGKIIESE